MSHKFNSVATKPYSIKNWFYRPFHRVGNKYLRIILCGSECWKYGMLGLLTVPCPCFLALNLNSPGSVLLKPSFCWREVVPILFLFVPLSTIKNHWDFLRWQYLPVALQFLNHRNKFLKFRLINSVFFPYLHSISPVFQAIWSKIISQPLFFYRFLVRLHWPALLISPPLIQAFLFSFCSPCARCLLAIVSALSWTSRFWRRSLGFLGGSCESRTCWAGWGNRNLPNEGGVVGVAEVCGENVFGELLDALDDKAFTIFGPADHIAILGVLHCRRSYF